MNANSKAMLVEKLQEWLDDEDVADDLGGNCGMWQDDTDKQRNAHLMADAVSVVVSAAELQSVLEKGLNGE